MPYRRAKLYDAMVMGRFQTPTFIDVNFTRLFEGFIYWEFADFCVLYLARFIIFNQTINLSVYTNLFYLQSFYRLDIRYILEYVDESLTKCSLIGASNNPTVPRKNLDPCISNAPFMCRFCDTTTAVNPLVATTETNGDYTIKSN